MSILRKIARNNLERQTGIRSINKLKLVKERQILKWKDKPEFKALSKEEQKEEIKRIFFPKTN